jgi:hypothetical protein
LKTKPKKPILKAKSKIMANPTLNIPKDKDQFELVPFVNEMTQHQLKVLVKRMWINFQDLACQLDQSNPEIATKIDQILDGKKTTTSKQTIIRAKRNNFYIDCNVNKKEIQILDINLVPIEEPLKGEIV